MIHDFDVSPLVKLVVVTHASSKYFMTCDHINSYQFATSILVVLNTSRLYDDGKLT